MSTTLADKKYQYLVSQITFLTGEAPDVADSLADLETQFLDYVIENEINFSGGTTDLVFAADVGPVLTDTTDGHTYRIISTAGVLSTTQVT